MSDKRYPPSSYDAKYPFNRVQVTESGHELHFDDTPGAERIRLSHKSGSHMEFSANGRVTEVVVAGKHTYVKGGVTETYDSNHDFKSGGSTRVSVSGDTHSEVAGHSTSMINGDSRSIVGGDTVSVVSGDAVSGVQGKACYKYGGGLEIKFDGSKSDHNTVNTIADVAANMQFGQTLDVLAMQDITITSQTKITLKVGGSTLVITDSSITLTSARIDLNP